MAEASFARSGTSGRDSHRHLIPAHAAVDVAEPSVVPAMAFRAQIVIDFQPCSARTRCTQPCACLRLKVPYDMPVYGSRRPFPLRLAHRHGLATLQVANRVSERPPCFESPLFVGLLRVCWLGKIH